MRDFGEHYMFVIGSSVAFAAVNALVTRGFRQRVKQEPPVVMALSRSLHRRVADEAPEER